MSSWSRRCRQIPEGWTRQRPNCVQISKREVKRGTLGIHLASGEEAETRRKFLQGITRGVMAIDQLLALLGRPPEVA